ncbi:MAG: hypothetical protein HY319_05480 [Armatimonadetes bacterium]|nr:hypothetical protein [Armatimonadota bacterium]
MSAGHVPLRIGHAEAYRDLTSGCRLIGPMGGETGGEWTLAWVPTRDERSVAADPRLENLELSWRQAETVLLEPLPDRGRLLSARPGAVPDTYYPLWLFDGGANWAAVDGHRGGVVSGDWIVSRPRALVHLALVCFLAVYGVFSIAFLAVKLQVAPIGGLKLGLGADLGGPVGTFLMIGVWAGLGYALLRALLGLLGSSVAAACTGRLQLPDRGGWRTVLTVNGAVALVELCDQAGGVLTQELQNPAQSELIYLLSGIGFLFLALFAAGCLRLGAGQMAVGPLPERLEERGAEGMAVVLAVYVTVFTVAAGLMASAVYYGITEAPDLLGARKWWYHGALAGTLLVLFVLPTGGRSRSTAWLGVLATVGGDYWLGSFAGTLLGMSVVLVRVRFQQRGQGGLGKALRVAGAFALGESVGRLVGRVVGAIFLGAEGGPIGAALGERVGGLSALFRADSSAPPSGN